MKILVINGDCIQVNSSANLCHIAYIQGMVELGYEVTLVSADGRDYYIDHSIRIPEEVKQYTYYGVTLYQKLSIKKNNVSNTLQNANGSNLKGSKQKYTLKYKVNKQLKKTVLSLYGAHGINAKFVRVARKFFSDENYDYLVSISQPPASHLLAYKLLKSGNVKAAHWIQIWEDPWYGDIYGLSRKENIRREEQRLLSFAEKVCYVSPLTLLNQQRLFSESASKMYWQPLPYYYKSDCLTKSFERNVYGYFGDYIPETRNLKPFYDSAVKMGIHVNICGNPSNLFKTTSHIDIHSRMPLKDLKEIEDNTNVLVFLCNKSGGQIPGKIYQYSATNKTILFILDGTEEDKQVLRTYFDQFNRYVFCENNIEDITRAISVIENERLGPIRNKPLEIFNPVTTIRNVLEGVSPS